MSTVSLGGYGNCFASPPPSPLLAVSRTTKRSPGTTTMGNGTRAVNDKGFERGTRVENTTGANDRPTVERPQRRCGLTGPAKGSVKGRPGKHFQLYTRTGFALSERPNVCPRTIDAAGGYDTDRQ